jgi:integrase/recombinase XerD
MKHLVHYNPILNESLIGFNIRLIQQGKSQSNIDSLTEHVCEFLIHSNQNGYDSPKLIGQDAVDCFVYYLLNVRVNKRTKQAISVSYMHKFREAILRYMEYIKGVKLGQSGINFPILKPIINEKYVLSREEIKQLFDTCDGSLVGMTDKCILALLYGCGLRRKELSTLEVNEIDLNKGVIRLDMTKTKHERDVVMSPYVQRIVEEYLFNARNLMLGSGSNETYLIVTEKGYKLSHDSIPFRLKRIVERAGMDITLSSHQLRHTIATHLLEHLTIEEVALFLGHTCIDSTQRYTHLKNNRA